MKEKKYRWILYLIITIIFVTIGIQVFWNYKNYQNSKQQLIAEVQQILDKVVDDYYAELAKKTTFGIFLDTEVQSDAWKDGGHIDSILKNIDSINETSKDFKREPHKRYVGKKNRHQYIKRTAAESETGSEQEDSETNDEEEIEAVATDTLQELGIRCIHGPGPQIKYVKVSQLGITPDTCMRCGLLTSPPHRMKDADRCPLGGAELSKEACFICKRGLHKSESCPKKGAVRRLGGHKMKHKRRFTRKSYQTKKHH